MGIYASNNGGANWISRNTGLDNGATNVTAIAYHPITPTLMVAATYDTSNFGRVWKSLDGGEKWNLTTAISGTTAPIMALAFSPADPSIIYAGEGNGKGNPPADTRGHTFRTFDGGTNWEVVDFSAGGWGESWSIIFADANTIYLGVRGGVWRSQDGGATWQAQPLPGYGFTNWVRVMLLSSNHNLFAGTHGPGVFRAAIGTTLTWQQISNGLTGILPWEVAADPANPARAYVVTDGSGIFRTANGGQTWETMDVAHWEYGITAVVAAPPVTGTVYIGLPNSVAYSLDGGDHWSLNNIPAIGNNRVESIAMHPVTPTLLYVGMTDTLSNAGSVWKYDGVWQALPIPGTGTLSPVSWLVYLPSNTILVGTNGAGVYRSNDGQGQTWSQSNNGLPNMTVYHLLYSYGKVWAGLRNGVAVSNDGGQTWVNRSVGISGLQVRRLAADPTNANVLYAATTSGLYRTTNAGQTWVLETGVLAGANVQSVSAVLESGTTRIYAATLGGFGVADNLRVPTATYTAAGVYSKTTQWIGVFLPFLRR